MKKTVAFILAVVLFAGMLSITAFAADSRYDWRPSGFKLVPCPNDNETYNERTGMCPVCYEYPCIKGNCTDTYKEFYPCRGCKMSYRCNTLGCYAYIDITGYCKACNVYRCFADGLECIGTYSNSTRVCNRCHKDYRCVNKDDHGIVGYEGCNGFYNSTALYCTRCMTFKCRTEGCSGIYDANDYCSLCEGYRCFWNGKCIGWGKIGEECNVCGWVVPQLRTSGLATMFGEDSGTGMLFTGVLSSLGIGIVGTLLIQRARRKTE